MDTSKISNADFAKFQRKLVDAGYLKKGYVAEGAYWEFDFSGGREATLAGIERFLRDVGLLNKKEQLLLAWMLNRTNARGECCGDDPA